MKDEHRVLKFRFISDNFKINKLYFYKFTLFDINETI